MLWALKVSPKQCSSPWAGWWHSSLRGTKWFGNDGYTNPKGNFINHRYSALKCLWNFGRGGGKCLQTFLLKGLIVFNAKPQPEAGVCGQVNKWFLMERLAPP